MTAAVRRTRKVTLIASGIGITPLRALLEEMTYAPGEAVLIYRARGERDLLFRPELDMLAARRGVRIVYLCGHRIPGRDSWLPAQYAGFADNNVLREIVPDIAGHDVFVCGPDGWTAAVVRAARAAGVPHSQLHSERFSW